MLKRIVALLFALADLAEAARGRSVLVRRFVIWILRRAEPVVWDFVVGAEPPSPLMPATDDAEALRLARSFRDLACELDCQASFAFAVEAGIHDEDGEAELSGFGAGRLLDIDNFLKILRPFVVAIIARAAFATGPPDTS